MHHLAQFNIERSDEIRETRIFIGVLHAPDPVNASAEEHAGFVWRLVSGDNDPPDLVEFEARGWLVNMSVWESLENLLAFVRSPGHLSIMKRRGEGFDRTAVSMCL